MAEVIKHDEVTITLDGVAGQIFERYSLDDVTILIDATPSDDPQVTAVHRLIVATPKLLEVCKEMHVLMRYAADGVEEHGGDSNILVDPIANRALAAIAGAKGE